ncbi:unnamed protein product [Ambrosiozyma monospora]|uniref:Unnamed protein product n=1 Tax=Ambrosiozyma monospora TaxID=43982 RepID=A0ACB5TYB0_AMBMO|nr:unnamed protein product [Ambrosiozyma monospora]
MDELFTGLPDAMIYAPAHYSAFRELDSGSNEAHDTQPIEGPLRDHKDRAVENEKIYASSLDERGKVDIDKLYNNLPSMKPSIQAMKRRGSKFELTDYLFVLEPNQVLYDFLVDLAQNKSRNEYDMDIFNNLIDLEDSAENNVFRIDSDYAKPLIMILPHNPYALTSGEFKFFEKDHECYLTDPQDLAFYTFDHVGKQLKQHKDPEKIKKPYWSYDYPRNDDTNCGWKSAEIYNGAKTTHFSDYPIPKPWTLGMRKSEMDKISKDLKKKCKELKNDVNDEGCSGINTWYKVYQDYEDTMNTV